MAPFPIQEVVAASYMMLVPKLLVPSSRIQKEVPLPEMVTHQRDFLITGVILRDIEVAADILVRDHILAFFAVDST